MCYDLIKFAGLGRNADRRLGRHRRPGSRRDRVKVEKSRFGTCVANPSGRGRPDQVRPSRAGIAGLLRYLYLTSTLAPTSSNFFLMVAASSLFTPSLIGLGAPSTRSLASLRPRLVTSRTALMTLILFAPAAVRTTVNSVFSSAAGAAAAPPPAGAAATDAAAADTPSFSSSNLTS